MNRAFCRFLLVGSFAAGLNVCARLLFSQLVSFEVAVAAAFGVAMSVAFVLNRWLVFEHSQLNVANQYGRFFLINVLALVQVWGVSVGLARLVFPAIGMTWHAPTIAHVIGVLCPVLTSFYGHKHFSFRRS